MYENVIQVQNEINSMLSQYAHKIEPLVSRILRYEKYVYFCGLQLSMKYF